MLIFVHLSARQVREANQMVEEMMLLANVTVAEVTLRGFPACAILRRHPPPAPRQFEPLLQVATATGASIDTSSSKAGPAWSPMSSAQQRLRLTSACGQTRPIVVCELLLHLHQLATVFEHA